MVYRPVVIGGNQTCRTCGESKLVTAFARNKSNTFGRDYTCKTCRYTKKETRRKTSKELYSPTDIYHRCIDPDLRREGMQRFGILPERLVMRRTQEMYE